MKTSRRLRYAPRGAQISQNSRCISPWPKSREKNREILAQGNWLAVVRSPFRPHFSSPAARKSPILCLRSLVSIEVSMPRATWTSDLPSISLSDDIIDRYMTCKCDRYMTVTGRVQTEVAQKLSILKQCSKLAPCARLSRPQASQPRLDYSAHPP